MSHKIHDVGAAKQIGKYSDAIETAAGLRWLHTSGTPGVADDDTVPEVLKPKPVSPRNMSVASAYALRERWSECDALRRNFSDVP
jgi:hypothetical protein